MMVHAVSALINGTWRTYRCATIAEVEALQDVFAKQGIEHKYAHL
jgi:hypothetical protein